MGLGRDHMSAHFGLGESVGYGKSGGDRLLHDLRYGAGPATAAGIAIPNSDGDFGEGEDLIVVWRDDELLNALGTMRKDVDSGAVPFDVSADWQLVELLLAWRVGFESFRDSARAMIWTADLRQSGDDAHRDRGEGEWVGCCAAWAGGESPRTIPRRLLLTGHLETERESQRQGGSPSRQRNVQVVKSTTERGLGR